MSGPIQKRYVQRVAIFTSLYLAAFVLMTIFKVEVTEATLSGYILAALPGFAVIGMFWAIGRLIVEETDEFLRMLTVRQVLVASALALSVASVWGFLEAAELAPHLDSYWFAVVWFAGLIVGAIANRIEHGTWGQA